MILFNIFYAYFLTDKFTENSIRRSKLSTVDSTEKWVNSILCWALTLYSIMYTKEKHDMYFKRTWLFVKSFFSLHELFCRLKIYNVSEHETKSIESQNQRFKMKLISASRSQFYKVLFIIISCIVFCSEAKECGNISAAEVKNYVRSLHFILCIAKVIPGRELFKIKKIYLKGTFICCYNPFFVNNETAQKVYDEVVRMDSGLGANFLKCVSQKICFCPVQMI